MLPMTSPNSSSRVLLVPDRRNAPSEPDSVPVRRYRLARLQLNSHPIDPTPRFEHLKRVYE